MKSEQRVRVWLFYTLALLSLVVGVWSFHSLQIFHQRLERLLDAEIALSQYQGTIYELQTSTYLSLVGETADARDTYDKTLEGIGNSLAHLKTENVQEDEAVIRVGEITCSAASSCLELLNLSESLTTLPPNGVEASLLQQRQVQLKEELRALGQSLKAEHHLMHEKIQRDIRTAHLSIRALLWTACVALLIGVALLMFATYSMWSIQKKLRLSNTDLEAAMKQLQQTQLELVQSEKLASVGQLAAGIAHEINTPIQFVGDNVRACADMLDDLHRLVNTYRSGLSRLENRLDISDVLADVQQVEHEVDPDFLFDDIPLAISQTLEGVERVRKIVRAMKDFSHSGTRAHAVSFDLNHCIQNTLTIAHNEIKYHADVELNLGNLPLIMGHPDEINQMLLNLILNACHAIQDRKDSERGLIRITTETDPETDQVVISLADTGCGIPESIRHRIFEPFFTTKEVGRGTGQGLAIVRNIVVESHHGTIDAESTPGVGTTFSVRLPCRGVSGGKGGNKLQEEESNHPLVLMNCVEHSSPSFV